MSFFVRIEQDGDNFFIFPGFEDDGAAMLDTDKGITVPMKDRRKIGAAVFRLMEKPPYKRCVSWAKERREDKEKNEKQR